MPPAAEASPADLLRPLPWRQGCEPAGPPPADPSAPPLLLLLDRRWPIDADVHRRLATSLTEAEQQRFSAYRLAADRERFLLGRGGLRRILGLWLGLAPEAVHLETGPHGKPHCPGGPAFNLSHSGELILLAVHASRPVGVDVERLRPALDWRAIAGRMLPERQRRALEALPEAERPEAFLAAWCRLEARLKARGDGLAGLERLRGEPEAAPRSASSAATERVWDVAVPAGYRAAVALAPQPAP
jgi:4'-phosphopantetheinyl transferase